jgi:iron complex transport system substrate-binding protein
VVAREGWDAIPAVRHGRVLEIKSADILSPGPSAIQHGLLQLHVLIAEWQASQPLSVTRSSVAPEVAA